MPLVGYREAFQTIAVPSYRYGELDEVTFGTNTRGDAHIKLEYL